MFCFNFSEHYSLSNILPEDSSKMSYTHKLIVSVKFYDFAKITLRVTSRIRNVGYTRVSTNIFSSKCDWSAILCNCQAL